MNTKLDEITLARWLDDELRGEELTAFEASHQPDGELLARREQVRAWRATVGAAIPAVIEPPYPEFFNSRIERAIRQQSPKAAWALPNASFWRAWWMPATAVAGMALAFWMGTKTVGPPRVVTVSVPSPAPMVVPVPIVYIPEHGVAAEWFSSPDAAATVIVLEGVEAIPDTLDLSETAALPGAERATAALEDTATGEMRQ